MCPTKSPKGGGLPTRRVRSKSVIQTGLWTPEEHKSFLEGLERFPDGTLNRWKHISKMIPTRCVKQVRTHAQKYLIRLKRRHRALQRQYQKSLSKEVEDVVIDRMKVDLQNCKVPSTEILMNEDTAIDWLVQFLVDSDIPPKMNGQEEQELSEATDLTLNALLLQHWPAYKVHSPHGALLLTPSELLSARFRSLSEPIGISTQPALTTTSSLM